MDVTISIEDALYERAVSLMDPGEDPTDVVRQALETFVRVQVAKRLAALGGSMPEAQDVRRLRDDEGED